METTPPPPPPAPPAGEGAETLVGLAAAKVKEEKVKRARKRSRYLSPPYTDHDAPEQAKQDKEKEEASLLLQLQEANVATADLLSALLQSAASASASASVSPPSPNVDAGLLLRFFSLYRISSLAKAADGSSHQGAMDDDAHGHIVLLRLSTCHAMAVAAKKQDEDMRYASAHHIGRPVTEGAAAALQAGHKRKKDASTDCPGGVANSAPKMKKTRKRHEKYFGNPAALVLDFTKDAIDLPSKEELLSAFRRFGFVIESETDITKDPRRARIVFGSSAEAEAAYNCAQTLGMFGPPFTLQRLEYLPPIKLNAPRLPSPAPKLPLSDIKKNLEKMIWSLTRPASFSNDRAHNLVEEMQGLMAKVDKVLSARPSATTGHHH